MGSMIAKVMGFEFPLSYRIFSTVVVYHDRATGSFMREGGDSALYIPAPFRARQDAGIGYAFLYIDCVTPSLFGGQNVNLLKAITVNSYGAHDFQRTSYKTE